MKFHAAIAHALADNGVKVMFGVIGDANLHVVDSFIRDCGGDYVAAANEAGAAVMALGFATVSGTVGVATVTHGPAVTNTLTGLVEGVKGQVPMVLVCGDTAALDRDGLQNIAQRELIVATGAGFEQVRAPETAVADVAMALRRAVLERRPIALNVPVDFQWLDIDYVAVPVLAPQARTLAPEGEQLDDAIGIIAAAKRPIIVAGRGAVASGAREALLRLADRIEAPVATTLKGKGWFDDVRGNLGVFGTLSTPPAVDIINQADCIIAFGASLNRYTTSHGAFLRGKRLIQCNADACEIGKTFAPTAALLGDAGLTADLIVRWLDIAEIAPSGFRSDAMIEAVATDRPATRFPDTSTATTIDLAKAIGRLEAALPKERTLVTDGGRFLGVPWLLMTVPEPSAFVSTIHFGSIGLGVSYAIGAAKAAPQRPVVLVTGDGGFMLGGLAEFNTAVRHAIDLVVVVCNDRSYGAEHIQFRRKQLDPALSQFEWPDFARLAGALGGSGVTVRTDADLDAAVLALDKRAEALLIDLVLDPDNVPATLR